MRKLIVAIVVCSFLFSSSGFALADQPKTAADVADHALTQVDKLGDLLSSFVQKLSAVAVQQAPQAWETAKEITVVNCLSTLVYALIGLALYIVLTIFNIKQCAKRLWFNEVADIDEKVCGTMGFLLMPQGVLILLCFGGLSAFKVFDAWAWIGLWHPELVIAKTLLHL